MIRKCWTCHTSGFTIKGDSDEATELECEKSRSEELKVGSASVRSDASPVPTVVLKSKSGARIQRLGLTS